MKAVELIDQLIEQHPALEICKESIKKACMTFLLGYRDGGKLLICGNGGSSADADHIVGELMKSFERPRPINAKLAKKLKANGSQRGKYLSENLQGAFPAISLHAHHALVSAICNDMDPELVFAQQVAGYGMAGDVLLAISTSGESRNVIDAAIVARSMGISVVALTGANPGSLTEFSDIAICVPGVKTHMIQELHLPVYHTICKFIELAVFG